MLNNVCFNKEIGIVMLFGFQSSKSGTFKNEATTSTFSSGKTTSASKLLLKNSVIKGYHVFQSGLI